MPTTTIGTYSDKTVKAIAADMRRNLKAAFPDCAFRVTMSREAIYVTLQRAPVSPLRDTALVITLLNDFSIANGVNAQEKLSASGFDFMREVVAILRRDYWEVNEKNVAFYLSLGVGRSGDPFVANYPPLPGLDDGSGDNSGDDPSGPPPPSDPPPAEEPEAEAEPVELAASFEPPKALTDARPIARNFGRLAYSAGIDRETPGLDAAFQAWLDTQLGLGFYYLDLVTEWDAGWDEAQRGQAIARQYGREGYALAIGFASVGSHKAFMDWLYASGLPKDWLMATWENGWREAYGEREVEHENALASGIEADIAYSFGRDAFVTQTSRLAEAPQFDTALVAWLRAKSVANHANVREFWWRGYTFAKRTARLVKGREEAIAVSARPIDLRAFSYSHDF